MNSTRARSTHSLRRWAIWPNRRWLGLALGLFVVSSGLACPRRPKDNNDPPHVEHPDPLPHPEATYSPVSEKPQGCEGSCQAGLCDETCPERRVRLPEKPLGLRHAPKLVAWMSADGEVSAFSPKGLERRHLPVPATAVAIRGDEVLSADKEGRVRVLRLRQEPVVASLDKRADFLIATQHMLGWFPDRNSPTITVTGGPPRSLGPNNSHLLHVTVAGGTTRQVRPDSAERNVVASESRFAFTDDREVYVVDETQPAYRIYRAANYFPYLLSFSGHQVVMLGVQCGERQAADPASLSQTCLERTDEDAIANLTVLHEDGTAHEIAQAKSRPWCATANDRAAIWCVGERVVAYDLKTARKKVLAVVPRAERPMAAAVRPVSGIYSLTTDGSLLYVGDQELRVRGLDWGSRP